MSAVDFHALEEVAGVAFQHDWQREWITRAIREWIEQREFKAQNPTLRDLKEGRWKEIRDHAQALAGLLGDDPAPLLEYPLFSDWGEERIGRERLRAELQSLAGRARALMNAKGLKGSREHATNLALAREAAEIFRHSDGTGSVVHAKGVGYYGALFDFTCEMFATAPSTAPGSPATPTRSTIAKRLQEAIKEEKAREREADIMEKKSP